MAFRVIKCQIQSKLKRNKEEDRSVRKVDRAWTKEYFHFQPLLNDHLFHCAVASTVDAL